jgi:hypothetical protein
MRIRALIAVMLISAFGTGFLHAESHRRDGNWWQPLEKL